MKSISNALLLKKYNNFKNIPGGNVMVAVVTHDTLSWPSISFVSKNSVTEELYLVQKCQSADFKALKSDMFDRGAPIGSD